MSEDPEPDFICVGAQKGGTRWLYDQLASHPDFWMPPIKELHYFDFAKPAKRRQAARRQKRRTRRRLEELGTEGRVEQRDWTFLKKYVAAMRQERSLDRYACLFDGKGGQITGDITPGYSVLDAEWIEALTRRFADLKVIFLAREPVERLWSQYCMALRKEAKWASMAIGPETILAFAEAGFAASRSFQSQIVKRWRTRVPHGQFGLFFFDDLRVDPNGLRGRVLNLLGAEVTVAGGGVAPDFNRKKTLSKIEMTDSIRAALVGYFADELKRCADELGGAAARWPDRYGI
jgi:Sulfotransferase family